MQKTAKFLCVQKTAKFLCVHKTAKFCVCRKLLNFCVQKTAKFFSVQKTAKFFYVQKTAKFLVCRKLLIFLPLFPDLADTDNEYYFIINLCSLKMVKIHPLNFPDKNLLKSPVLCPAAYLLSNVSYVSHGSCLLLPLPKST